MAKRGTTDLSGVLVVDKPSGMTSHDVITAVRRATTERRVGHAGTLDPMATGLLVVLVGPATRLAPYLTAKTKSYDARIVFGTATDTDDAEGEVVRSAEVSPKVADPAFAAERVAQLVGTREQMPPAYSAIKRDGVTAYKAARAGEALLLEAREIEVTSASLRGVDPGPPVSWDVSLEVSKGTYIRSIARDLGEEVGSAAHLAALRRTSSGSLRVEDAHSLDEITQAGSGEIAEMFVPAISALGLPVVEVDESRAGLVANGRMIEMDAGEDAIPGEPVALGADGRLLAIYAPGEGSTLAPLTVIPGGVA